MADGRILKLREPYANKVFDDLRVEILAAVDGLADTTVSAEDLYSLMDVVLEMTVSALTERQQLLERLEQLEGAVARAARPSRHRPSARMTHFRQEPLAWRT